MPQSDQPTASPENLEPNAPASAHYRQTLLGRVDQKLLSTKAARIALLVLLGAALFVPAIQFVVRIQQTDKSLWRAGGERHRTALGRWLPTAKLLAEPQSGEDPYGFGHWFPTPPMVLISLVPFAKLGYVGAGIAWSVLKIAGLLLAMVLLLRGLGPREFPVPLGVIVAAGLFAIRPVISDPQHGNLNLFMLIWIAFAWALFVRGKDFPAGLFVALAIVTKITPALLLVYFAYKRRWRVCAGAIVGLLLVFVLIPGALLGSDQNHEYLASWFDMLIRPVLVDGYTTLDIANQSLGGVAVRLLSNAGIMSIEEMPVKQLMKAGMEDMARPATMLGRLLRPVLSLSSLALLAWLCRSRCKTRRDPRLLLELGLTLLAMLLLSERTWKHHATTLPIVYLAVWYALTCLHFSDKFRAWFVAGLIVQFALLVGSGGGILPDDLADHLLDGGVFCWGLLLCFVQTGVLLTAINRREAFATSKQNPPNG